MLLANTGAEVVNSKSILGICIKKKNFRFSWLLSTAYCGLLWLPGSMAPGTPVGYHKTKEHYISLSELLCWTKLAWNN